MPMTPRSLQLAEQASKEMDSGKLMHLIAELCRAIDTEREENRKSRRGCAEDCKEYEPPVGTTAGPSIGSHEARSPCGRIAI
jgi:hypothetical protein